MMTLLLGKLALTFLAVSIAGVVGGTIFANANQTNIRSLSLAFTMSLSVCIWMHGFFTLLWAISAIWSL